MAAITALLLGAQLAFLVFLPELSALIQDRESLWLVFSTWPDMYNGLYNLLIIFSWDAARRFAQDHPDVADVLLRIRAMRKLNILTAIGVVILLIPAFAFFRVTLVRIALTILLIIIGHMIFLRAEKRDVPRIPLSIIAGLSWGFVADLILTDTRQLAFDCRPDMLQLRSGEYLPCTSLLLFEGKALWLIEGPAKPRLVAESDVDWEDVGDPLRK